MSLALCGEYGDLAARLKGAGSAAQKRELLKQAGIQDEQLKRYVSQFGERGGSALTAASEYVELKAIAEQVANPSGAAGKAKQIKSSTLYRDEGEKESANWLAGAIERMKNLVPRYEPRTPDMGSAPNVSGIASFLIYFVWFLLGAAVIAFIVYALRFVKFGKLKKRAAKAMLEDTEPERTLDEWLALADSYEREARYREAVRALYLACLLKFDERNVARFMRGQTNWEHLARIESSPKKPNFVDFRTPTQSFDRIWYGHKVRGSADVADFKQWYGEITSALKEAT